VKGTPSPQVTDTEQQDNTGLPPEPKTPDAMAHMPEQMKTEYKKLKEQLALRESKTRQPLTTVNQEKGTCRKMNQTHVNFICLLIAKHVLWSLLPPLCVLENSYSQTVLCKFDF